MEKIKKIISLEKTGDKNKFRLIVNNNSIVLTTHMDDEFPALLEDLAVLLSEDLMIPTGNAEAGIYQESLIYCLLSTLAHSYPQEDCGDPDCPFIDHYSFGIKPELFLSTDRVYDLDPNPEYLAPQLRAVEPLRNPAGKKLANYKEFCKYYEELYNKLNRMERFSVMLINQLYDSISFSASVGLIAREISPEQFYRIYLALEHLKKSDRLSAQQKQGLKEWEERISFLLRSLDSEGIKEFI